ncbi:exonuclease [Candidatus Woesearchaeota archaeon]|nr:MAG: exonuclease [Candidatus Woesearchaeota archaeon]
MLFESFVHLPRVSSRRERAIWSQGVRSWSDFLRARKIRGFSGNSKELCDWRIRDSMSRLESGDVSFFANAFPKSENWRLYDSFKDGACFLDIETDGYYGGVTVVGVSDGSSSSVFVRGFNLERYLVERELSKYDIILTFNGSSFDIPVLERYFNMRFSLPHIDLRFVCQKVGLSGGLKAIERALGISRESAVCDFSGADAVMLWRFWKETGDRKYLELLVEYNEEDCANLKPLADFAIPKLWSKVRWNC